MLAGIFHKSVRSLASLKVAIPLLVILTAVTVIGSLFPTPDMFRTWWYMGLLGVLGLSLLLITILHIPRILRRKGRNALIGVITTHAGILVLIAAAMYGNTAASRWQFRAIEGEMTVVPGMPFVVELERLAVEEYRPEEFPSITQGELPKKRQDSEVRLYRLGQEVAGFTISPGRPARYEGYTLLTSVADLGWTFQLIVTDPLSREQTIQVRPWSPPIIAVGERQVMAHPAKEEPPDAVEVFTMQDGQPLVLGSVSGDSALDIGGYEVRLGGFQRYVGMSLYNRPHMSLLVAGVLLMMVGLVWHFYHRYRD